MNPQFCRDALQSKLSNTRYKLKRKVTFGMSKVLYPCRFIYPLQKLIL